jgi:NAD(P)-dependent dehydrogenase (short-subunit alcohol dehydrogenase family)
MAALVMSEWLIGNRVRGGQMNVSLEDNVALVTGGSRGIGKAIALGLARAGADVVIASRKLSDLQKVADEIGSLGRNALALPAHVAKIEEIDTLVNKVIDTFGKIDILVNNAGFNPVMDSALDIDERAWDVIMNLNLKGLFFLSQAVARLMRQHGGGKIVNISSVEGITPTILPVYSISKAGIIMATKVMAKEWAQYNIRVNAVAPGLTKTRFSEALWGNEQILQAAMSRTPMARIAEPEDMVGTVLYLTSDLASHVTGQIVAVDGGYTI